MASPIGQKKQNTTGLRGQSDGKVMSPSGNTLVINAITTQSLQDMNKEHQQQMIFITPQGKDKYHRNSKNDLLDAQCITSAGGGDMLSTLSRTYPAKMEDVTPNSQQQSNVKADLSNKFTQEGIKVLLKKHKAYIQQLLVASNIVSGQKKKGRKTSSRLSRGGGVMGSSGVFDYSQISINGNTQQLEKSYSNSKFLAHSLKQNLAKVTSECEILTKTKTIHGIQSGANSNMFKLTTTATASTNKYITDTDKLMDRIVDIYRSKMQKDKNQKIKRDMFKEWRCLVIKNKVKRQQIYIEEQRKLLQMQQVLGEVSPRGTFDKSKKSLSNLYSPPGSLQGTHCTSLSCRKHSQSRNYSNTTRSCHATATTSKHQGFVSPRGNYRARGQYINYQATFSPQQNNNKMKSFLNFYEQ